METNEAIQRHFRFSGRNRNLPWYPRRGKRGQLAILFGRLGFNEGVEVGTFRGVWALELMQANPELHLTCIDPWLKYDLVARKQETLDSAYDQAMERLNGLNVTTIRKKSMDAVNDFEDGSMDFVYIDGNHAFNYVMMDLIHWVPKVKKGGIFALHDYHGQVGADVIKAVDAYTHVHHIDPWYITREELPTAFWVQK
jgi:predicted O-methyltransferase YrrM